MSHLEDEFLVMLRRGCSPDLPCPVRELVFAPPRKWRFDFAWPDHKFAVEIEGGVRTGGRHQRPDGFVADAEKYEQAMLLGWTVYRIPGVWIAVGTRRIWRPETITTINQMLQPRTPADDQ